MTIIPRTTATLTGALVGALVIAAAGLSAARADSPSEFVIVIKDHRFDPAELAIPAGQRVKLVIDNRDGTPEEFESKDLRREKVIPGGSSGFVWVGPLPAGTYEFFGDFHQDTAQGKLIAK